MGRKKGEGGSRAPVVNRRSWVEVGVDVQGLRDDDALTVFLAGVVMEGLLAGDQSGEEEGLTSRLRINDRYHWKLYVDVCLLSSHPLPLHVVFTHSTPKLTSEPTRIDPLDHSPSSLPFPQYHPPPHAPLLYNPPCPPHNPSSGPHIPRQRRPLIQRRLGSRISTLSSPHLLNHHSKNNPNYPPPDLPPRHDRKLRQYHPPRPLPRRTLGRRRSLGNHTPPAPRLPLILGSPALK